MARRKLFAIPWGDTAPAVEPFNGQFYPTIEIDDQTGTVYVGQTATTPSAISIPDSVQPVSISQSVNFAGAVHTFITAIGGVSGIIFTLPSPAGSDANGLFKGRCIKIKKVDAAIGAVTINGLIDSDTQYVLSNQGQYVVLESDSGVWEVVGNN